MEYQKPEVEVIKFDKNNQFMTASGTGNCQVIIRNSNGTSYCAIVTGVSGGAYAGEVCYKLTP